MLKRGLFKISIFIVLVVIAFSASGKKRNDAVQPYLETKINRHHVIEGEMLIYEVVLHTPDPNIIGIELEANPAFNSLPVTRSAADNNLDIEEHDGLRLYSAVIDRFFIDANIVGKHKLRGGKYNIGYGKQVALQDPFWGPYMADKVEVLTLPAPDLTINVSSLPLKGKTHDFSGAVGDFMIEMIIPDGVIHVGDEAVAIVTITGEGDLSTAKIPELRSIFPNELTFRSMTESRNHFVKDGVVGSEIEIECIFIPQKEGEYVIEQCSFSFYNPAVREYQRVVSDSVSVVISPSSAPTDSAPQYMDI